MSYVGGEREPGCVFCNALAANDDPGRLVIHGGQHAFVILNLYPYATGHAMIVPNAHQSEIEALDAETRAEMFELASLTVEASRRTFRCDGFNLGMNLGTVAGAGVADHLHMHIVPRWTGDANFMPILGDTMVMPELLPVTYARLRAELEALLAGRQREAIPQAGGLVVIPEDGTVILRRGKNGDIVLPKGHVESGETLAETALREIHEETGVRASIVGWAGSDEFTVPARSGKPALHYSAYFIATGTTTPQLIDHLATDTFAVPIEQAASRLSVPSLRAIVERATPLLHHLAQVDS